MTTVRYAGFWIRVGATLLDIVVLVPLIVISIFAKNPWIYLVISVLMIVYKPILEKLFGATAGKLLVGLRVVDPSAGPITWGAAWLRAAFGILAAAPGVLMGIKQRQAGIGMTDLEALQAFQRENAGLQWISWGTFVLWVIAVVTVAFHPRKQGLHDMLADTFVVYKESLPHTA